MWENKKSLGSWSCRDTQLVSALLRPPVTPIAGALAQRHPRDHAALLVARGLRHAPWRTRSLVQRQRLGRVALRRRETRLSEANRESDRQVPSGIGEPGCSAASGSEEDNAELHVAFPDWRSRAGDAEVRKCSRFASFR